MFAPCHRVALALVLFVCGCGGKEAVTPAAKAEPAPAAGPVQPVSKNIAVDDEIAKRCGLVVGKSEAAPKFDFDRSELSPGDREVLHQVATCVTTGPLKGRSLRLVGRTDPRGEVEYNLALGGRRAGAAREILVQAGVDKKHLEETSRGELDAAGKNEEGWRQDRRVDILLL